MTVPHYLPIPAVLRTLACDTVSRRIARLPFVREGVTVTCDLVAAGMESLNAQATRMLLLTQMTGGGGRKQVDRLDHLLEKRGFGGPDTARVLSDVLQGAGITEPAAVADHRSRRLLHGIRLLPAWTWHIASDLRKSYSPPPGAGTSGFLEVPSWKNLCAVCKTGTLNVVTGERLFGIPATDFLVCSYCGTKFVPDNDNYRLVSVAIKRDPLWSRHLNKTKSPDEWEAIARNSVLPQKKQRFRKQGDRRQNATSITRQPEKNIQNAGGRLVVPLGAQTLYFIAINLHYRRRNIHDLFSKNATPLQEMIRLPAYRHQAQTVQDHYSHYLDTPVGFFLLELKNRNDGFYREFLHEYGDGTFCIFCTDAVGSAARRGVFVVAVKGEVSATGSSPESFSRTVNDELGWLAPETCYLAGDPARCRINSLVCRHRKDAGIFVHPVDDNNERERLVMEVNAAYCRGKS